MTGGFNPMRWNCHKGGRGENCFNRKCRPKIEVFAECFPGLVNFGDMDGRVELDGYYCELEWKGEGGKLNIGQIRTFNAVTSVRGNIVYVVEGDAETMKVVRYCRFWQGKQRRWQTGNLEALKADIKRWVAWVNPIRNAAA